MRSSTRSNLLILALAVTTLAGCADYMNRRDSVSLRAGNASEANSAIHVINPSPPIAYERRAK
jgi:hypothetical protein